MHCSGRQPEQEQIGVCALLMGRTIFSFHAFRKNTPFSLSSATSSAPNVLPSLNPTFLLLVLCVLHDRINVDTVLAVPCAPLECGVRTIERACSLAW